MRAADETAAAAAQRRRRDDGGGKRPSSFVGNQSWPAESVGKLARYHNVELTSVCMREYAIGWWLERGLLMLWASENSKHQSSGAVGMSAKWRFLPAAPSYMMPLVGMHARHTFGVHIAEALSTSRACSRAEQHKHNNKAELCHQPALSGGTHTPSCSHRRVSKQSSDRARCVRPPGRGQGPAARDRPRIVRSTQRRRAAAARGASSLPPLLPLLRRRRRCCRCGGRCCSHRRCRRCWLHALRTTSSRRSGSSVRAAVVCASLRRRMPLLLLPPPPLLPLLPQPALGPPPAAAPTTTTTTPRA